jgi:hypothetical protein
MIGAYVLAKTLEFFDARIYEITGILSGHTLKHVAAALAPLAMIRTLLRRCGDRIDG